MEQLALASEIELAPGRIQLNNEDVTAAIRTPEVTNGASRIAVIPGVRRAMVAKQREIGQKVSVVMEGRDIGTVVFPNADLKVFLDASIEERVRRRLAESRAKGVEVSESVLAAQMKERDARDSTRADAPLAQAPDAVYLDSTNPKQDGGDADEGARCAREHPRRRASGTGAGRSLSGFHESERG